jgi:hypothetical protein
VTEMSFTAIALATTSQAANPDGRGRPSAELRIVLESVAVCLSGATILDVVLGDVPNSRGYRPGVRRANG